VLLADRHAAAAARDLRAIITAMNIIVDLERMGDQAKGIAKTIPRLGEISPQAPLAELQQMGDLVGKMLNQVMIAYAHTNTDLARIIARQDDEVDALYAQVFNRIMAQMAVAGSSEKAESAYELLRVARELERFGDLVTNVWASASSTRRRDAGRDRSSVPTRSGPPTSPICRRFEFIAFLGKLVAEDYNHDQPLATEVASRAEMTRHPCPNHFAICAALGSLSSVALSSAQMTISLSDPSYFRQFVVLTGASKSCQ
jgi:phosphate uptake regulator